MHNYSLLRSDASRFDTQASLIEGDPSIGTLQSALWYAWNLLNDQLYLVPFLFLVVGIVYLVRSDEMTERNFYPVLWVVGSYLTFTLLRNKDPRYTLPMIPGVAIIATSWLELVPTRIGRRLSLVLVAYGAVTFFAVSFGTGLLPKTISVHLGAKRLMSKTTGSDVVLFAQTGYIIGPPTSENWHQQDLFVRMAQVAQPDRTFWFEGGDSIWFNTWGTRYYSYRYHATWVGSADSANFVIARGAPATPVPAAFHPIEQFTLPDGEPLALYQRIG